MSYVAIALPDVDNTVESPSQFAGYVNGHWIVSTDTANEIYESDDNGATWTLVNDSEAGDTGALTCLAYGGGLYIRNREDGMATSSDLQAWTSVTTPFGFTGGAWPKKFAYSGTEWMTSGAWDGDSVQIAYSSNGSSWTTVDTGITQTAFPDEIAYFDGAWWLTAGSNVYRSTNKTTWTLSVDIGTTTPELHCDGTVLFVTDWEYVAQWNVGTQSWDVLRAAGSGSPYDDSINLGLFGGAVTLVDWNGDFHKLVGTSWVSDNFGQTFTLDPWIAAAVPGPNNILWFSATGSNVPDEAWRYSADNTTAITESAATTDALVAAGSYYFAVREGLQATTSAALQAAYHQTLSETALGQVVIDANKHFEALITEAVTGNVGAALVLGTQLVELGLSADNSATLRQLAVDVAEIIVALSSLAQGTTYDVVESAAVNDSVAPLVTALALLIESAVAADATTPALTLMAVVEESFTAADTPAALLAALAIITEAINAGVLLRLGDDYYVGWVLNPEGVMTRNGPQPTVSQYQNYPFNSFAGLGGRYYAAGSDGIYELTGSDDAGTPIVGYLKSGKLDFGSSQQKRLDSAYFAVATDGVVRLKVITHDRGENVETWYQVVSRDDGAVAENIRVQVGKGLKSRYWQFELVVEDATSFELEEFMLIPLTLTRRL